MMRMNRVHFLKTRNVLALGLFLVFFMYNLVVPSIRDKAALGSEILAVTFDVCGGFTNQILSISFATTVAIHVHAEYLILPSLNSKGLQVRRVSVQDDKMGFDRLFDLPYFSSSLSREFGVVSLANAPRIISSKSKSYFNKLVCKGEESLAKCFEQATKHSKKQKILHLECPFLSHIWDSNFLIKKEYEFNSALAFLKVNEYITSIADLVVQEFFRRSGSECMNVLHVRVEKDWEFHCIDYAGNNQMSFFDCFVLPSEIFSYSSQLDFFQCSIYLTYDAGSISESLLLQITEERMKLPVKSFTFDELSRAVPSLERETRAAIDRKISLKYADKFMGNSISTFSAMIIRERRRQNKWAAQYNRGEIPLARFVPGYRIPWIFSVRGEDKVYDYMMYAALRSAQLNTTLIPYCMIHPNEEHFKRTAFLRKHGVNIIIHKPEWEDKLLEILATTSPEEKARSHLYEFPKAVLGTYARLDIPILSQLSQYEHYLYTDTDVYFRQDISPLWKELVFPAEIKMGYEDADHFPMNAGIIIASMPFMRKTYSSFLTFVLAKSSIDHGQYGPGDQGALNEYYSSSLKYQNFFDDLNVKPYKIFRDTARIVHFHGPKPHDYLGYIRTGKCRFNNMCKRGLDHGVCKIFSEWIQLTESYEDLFNSETKCEILTYCAGRVKLGLLPSFQVKISSPCIMRKKLK